MPIVPRYGDLQVQTQARPNVRQSPDAPAGAFGVPTPDIVGGAASQLTDIVKKEKSKADQVQVLAADNGLAALENKLLYDTKDGVLNKRGSDAFDAPERVSEAWREGVSDIESKLTSDDQRLAFARMRNQREANLNEAVQRHVSGELRSYDEQQTQSFLTNERSATLANYQDSDRVQLGIARQQAALKDFAGRNGWASEKLKDALTSVASQTHMGVIERMLTNDQDIAASDYFKAHKTEMSGDDLIKAEKQLEEGSTRGESQRSADSIWAKHKDDPQAALDATNDLKDPKVRDLTRERIKGFISEGNAIKQQTQENLYLRATNLLDQPANANRQARDVIPAPIWSQLTLSMRSALENRVGDNVTNDDQKWLQFLSLTPQDTAKLNQAQFESQYWAFFDKQHRARAETLWNSATDAMANKEAFPNLHLAATASFHDRLENTLRLSGLIPADKTPAKLNKDEAKTYAAFEQEAASQIEQYELQELGGKRPATGDEQQKIIDALTLKKVFINRPWRSDPEKLSFMVTNDEAGRAYVPISKIPSIEKAQLQNVLKSHGSKITDDRLQRLYAAVLLNNRTLFDSITGEK